MKKKSIVLSATLILFAFAFLSTTCKKQNTSDPTEPTLGPVERAHMDELPVQPMKFSNGKSADYKILLDKTEMVAILFSLKKGDEIPAHFHKVNKAVYIYDGKAEVFAQNKMNLVVKGDTLYIPQSSVTSVKNASDEIAKVFFFFPIGFFKSLAFNSPEGTGLDTAGDKIQLLKEINVPWENWDGKIPAGGKVTPLAWKTIIDNDSMVLGITKIDPNNDVDSHFHKPTQIVIFSDGEGKTHIAKGEYKEIKKDNYIYPPTYSVHHSINTSKTEPLMEVYFFPTGPFSTIKYLGKGKKFW
jgi:quercetin dioxygenase-like cupin family protein